MKPDFEAIRTSDEIRTYITQADASLIALGYTEHSFAHVTRCAQMAAHLLSQLGYDQRQVELARIAGYMHDIGNVVNRVDHAQSGAVMAFRILDKLGFDPDETATIVTAIGNHDEGTAFPVNAVAAALILADKTDVRANRVRNQDMASFDIHDRVNFSVKESQVLFEPEVIRLALTIDTEVCPVMDYFEIFIDRMILCRKAAEKLGVRFALSINGQAML